MPNNLIKPADRAQPAPAMKPIRKQSMIAIIPERGLGMFKILILNV